MTGSGLDESGRTGGGDADDGPIAPADPRIAHFGRIMAANDNQRSWKALFIRGMIVALCLGGAALAYAVAR